MSERRQNMAMWVIGLVCLALVVAAMTADGPAVSTDTGTPTVREAPARVYTDEEMQMIEEYNDSGPQVDDLDHPSAVQGGGTP